MNAKIALPILSALTLAVGLTSAAPAEAHPASGPGRGLGYGRGPSHAPPHRVRDLEARLRDARQRARVAEREARIERRARIQAQREADRLRLDLRRAFRAPGRPVGHVHRLRAENEALRVRLDRAEAQVRRLRRRTSAGGLAHVDVVRGGRR